MNEDRFNELAKIKAQIDSLTFQLRSIDALIDSDKLVCKVEADDNRGRSKRIMRRPVYLQNHQLIIEQLYIERRIIAGELTALETRFNDM